MSLILIWRAARHGGDAPPGEHRLASARTTTNLPNLPWTQQQIWRLPNNNNNNNNQNRGGASPPPRPTPVFTEGVTFHWTDRTSARRSVSISIWYTHRDQSLSFNYRQRASGAPVRQGPPCGGIIRLICWMASGEQIFRYIENSGASLEQVQYW